MKSTVGFGFGLLIAAAAFVQPATELRAAPADSKKAATQQKGKNLKSTTSKKGDKSKSETKPEAAEQAKPIPKEWSVEKIAEERQLCEQILATIDVIAIPETSFRKGACGAPAPIRLVAIGKSPQVALSPPALMTCRLASALHRWTTQDLQRLAQKHLKDEIIRIEVMSDYSCRRAYGRKSGRLSEHALANALDIRGFSTRSGKVVRLLSSWGPTARDIAAEKERAKRAREAKLKAEQEAAKHAAEQKKQAEAQSTEEKETTTAKQVVVKRTRDLLNVGTKLATAAKRALAKSAQKQTPMLPLSKRISRRGYFLRDAHKAACKIFGTTLGPEANDAHRNHFHVDMSPRRRNNFCE